MKRNPTQTNVLIKGFERQLRVLISNFSQKAIPQIEQSIQSNKPRLNNQNTIDGRQKIMNSAVDELNSILDGIEYEEITSKLRPVMKRYCHDAYTKGARRAISDINKFPGYDINFDILPMDFEAVDVMIEHNLIEMKGATNFMKKEIFRVVSTGMLEGQSIPQMTKAMRERIGVTKTRANMIARTETIRNYAQASVNKYEQNGIKKWRWIAAAGDRTCDLCASLDGHIFKVGDPQPPFPHPNCRCSVSPFIESSKKGK